MCTSEDRREAVYTYLRFEAHWGSKGKDPNDTFSLFFIHCFIRSEDSNNFCNQEIKFQVLLKFLL